MDDYVEWIIIELPMIIIKIYTALTPDGNTIFGNFNIKSLGKKETEDLYASVSRGMFLAKRARPDIHQMVAVLSIRIK